LRSEGSLRCGSDVWVNQGIPETAVRALIELCNRFGEKTGRSGAEVFKDYLEWIKKHADYFFSAHWPPKYVPKGTWLNREECAFILDGKDYEEEVERFTVVLLKRNLSLEGLKTEYFEQEFGYYGRMFCGHCSVPAATHLREYIAKLEELAAWIEKQKSMEPNDSYWMKLYDSPFSAETSKSAEMARVQLRFLEVDGAAEGKACAVRNKYLCPYGKKSRELVKRGDMVRYLWLLIEFYDRHWNNLKGYKTPLREAKSCQVGDSSLLEVTSRDDILKALEDGRMDKIVEEFRKHNKKIEHN
jgi:hypothetical protein